MIRLVLLMLVAALVLGYVCGQGLDKAAKAEYDPCQTDEAFYIANRMGEARMLHQWFVGHPDVVVAHPDVGSVEWHRQWVLDYDRTLSWIAVTLHECSHWW